MKIKVLFCIFIIVYAIFTGCVSNSGEKTHVVPESYGNLDITVDYTQGCFLSITNNESWAWKNTRLELNDRYTCRLWGLEPGETMSFEISLCTDSEGMKYDYLLQTCEKLVITCDDPEGTERSYVYYAPTEGSSTVPPTVNTTPIRASEAQAALAEYQTAMEPASARMVECCGALQAVLLHPNPDYVAIYGAFEDYEMAIQAYEHALYGSLRIEILLAHTTPIQGDLLELRKETIPFSRPEEKMYTFGELNMKGESYMHIIDRIRSEIRDGIAGQDTLNSVIDDCTTLEEFLPGYYDMSMGYIYYDLNQILARQELYSDVLIHDCNPHCLGI